MPEIIVENNTYTIEPVFRFDTNQVLEIKGLSFAKAPEVHFAHDGDEYAIVRPSTMDAAGVIRAKVPNYLLEKARRINVYLCTHEGDVFKTEHHIKLPVRDREQPSDWEGTNEVEVYSLDALGAEVFTIAPGTDATVEKVLHTDGTWTLRFSIPRGEAGKDGEDGKDGQGVPAVTAADNGKVLGVVDGQIALVTPSYPVITQNGTVLRIE